MKKIDNIQQAYDADGLDANGVVITGVPERHLAAAKAVIDLFMIHDFVNDKFNPDYCNSKQKKYSPIVQLGSSSGPVFSCLGYDHWLTLSRVGSRLESESIEALEHIFEKFPHLYEALMVYKREIK